MNLFEFSQLLRRRRSIFIVGTLLIVGLVAFMSFEYDNGLRPRFQPRYESSIQMAVVPAEFESLGNALPNVGLMAGTTSLYATLLASPEAAIEISNESGVPLLDTLAVGTTGKDGFIDVKATAGDAQGAIDAALYSYVWLEQRLATPPSIVRPVQLESETVVPPDLDADGQLMGTIRLEASPAFAETAVGLWLGLSTSDSAVTMSLADAGLQATEFSALLEPEGEMVVSLEDVFGNELDSLSIQIPPLPDQATDQYQLAIRLDRGVLLFPRTSDGATDDVAPPVASDARLLARHVDVSWQPSDSGVAIEESAEDPDAVGLLLLTESPIAWQTGARKGPVVMLAALVGGFFGLIVLAVGVDAWVGAKRKSEIDRFPIAELTGDDPRRTARSIGRIENPRSPNWLPMSYNDPRENQWEENDEYAID